MKDLSISEDPSKKAIERIFNYYSDLLAVITKEMILFSKPHLFDINENNTKSKWRKNVDRATSPFLFLQTLEFFDIISFSLMGICFMVWLAWIVVGINGFFGLGVKNSNPSQPVTLDVVFTFLIMVPASLAGPIIYRTAIDLLRSRDNPVFYKILWVGILMLWGYLVFRWIVSNNPNASFDLVLSSAWNVFLFACWVLLIVIPALICAATLIIYGGFLIIQMVRFVFMYFVVAHRVTSYRILQKVLYEPIRYDEIKLTMTELNMVELDTLREWARDNREGTEKRIIPATVFLAAMGLFANSSIADNLITNFLKFLKVKTVELSHSNLPSSLSPDTALFFFVIVPLCLLTLMLLVTAYFALFHNLVTQSYIIEACTLAMYAVEEKKKRLKETENIAAPHYQGLFQWLYTVIRGKLL
jgi:hypothetical protein